MFLQGGDSDSTQDYIFIRVVPGVRYKYVTEQTEICPQEILLPVPYLPPPPQCIIHVLPSCSQDFWRGVNCVDMSSRPNYTTAVMISFPCIFPSGASRSMLKSYSASISSPWGQWLMAVTTRSMVEAFSGAS